MTEVSSPSSHAALDRRARRSPSIWGELVVETSWRPTDKPKVESEGWLRANGYLPERRGGR